MQHQLLPAGRQRLFLAVALITLLFLLPLLPVAPARAVQGQVTLSGTVTPALKGATLLGPTNSAQQLDLAFTLVTQHAAQLQTVLKYLNNRASPSYQHWLSSAQFQQQFGLSDVQLTKVKDYLRGVGIVVGRLQGPFLLDATATVAQAEKAFGVQINNYRGADGSSFFAAASDARIPARLAGLVSGVVGLDNAEHWSPHLASPQSAKAHYGGGPGRRGGGLTPPQLRSIYNATPLYQAGIMGAGQSSGVFELSSLKLADIMQYISYYQLPWSGQFQLINLTSALDKQKYGPLEVDLDVELQLALAPKIATFYIYNATNNSAGTVSEFARIASDNLAKSVSTSWGNCERLLPSQLIQSENQSFEQMAAQGQSIYAASGDFGSHDCGLKDPNLGVDDPAAQPYVVGTGGTMVTTDPRGNSNPGYLPEVTWNVDRGPGILDASGGGISLDWQLQPWETGPGVINSFSSGAPCNASPGNYCRQVPDVALNSDPNTGYSVYCTEAYPCDRFGWLMEAGTSAAAPLWAAFNVLVNQVRAQNGLGTYRLSNQSLYALAGSGAYQSVFHDITIGNNCYPRKFCNCPQLCYYPATPNYDLATGWGSVDMQQLLIVLSQSLYIGSEDGSIYQFDGSDSGQGWHYQTGGKVDSSPVVSNGVLYAGSGDGYVYALNALNGALLWRYPTGSPVISTPLVLNGIVYIGSSDNSLYALNATSGALVWSYATGGAVTSSPAISNGVLYVGSNDNSLYALNAASGALIRSYATGGSINSSPTISNGIVYIGSNDNSLYALNATSGALVWSYATGGAVTSSPAISNGVLYVGSNDNTVYALNATSGALVWSYATGGAVNSSPSVVNNILYTGSNDGSIYALNATTGQLIWSAPTNSSASASPAVANGLLYEGLATNTIDVFNANSGVLLWSYITGGPVTGKSALYLASLPSQLSVYAGSGDHNLYALNNSTGSMRWSFTTGASISSKPAIANGIAYFGSNDNFIYAVNTNNGTQLWSYQTGGAVSASPLALNGSVYVGSSDDFVYALNATTGAFAWSYQTGGAVLSSATIASGVLYVGSSDGYLYALNASTGAFLWSYLTGGAVISSPIVANDLVYVGSNDAYLYALNAATGALQWRYQTGGAVVSSPTVWNANVYAGSSDSYLYALNASTGALLWQYQTGGPITSSPTIAFQTLYIGSSGSYLYALDARAGALQWRFQTGGAITASPALVNGVAYFGSNDSKLYALNASTGAPIWTDQTGGAVSSPAIAP